MSDFSPNYVDPSGINIDPSGTNIPNGVPGFQDFYPIDMGIDPSGTNMLRYPNFQTRYQFRTDIDPSQTGGDTMPPFGTSDEPGMQPPGGTGGISEAFGLFMQGSSQIQSFDANKIDYENIEQHDMNYNENITRKKDAIKRMKTENKNQESSLELNPIIIFTKNFLNYFLNIDNASFLYAIIENDILLFLEHLNKNNKVEGLISKTNVYNKFILQNFESILVKNDETKIINITETMTNYKTFLDELTTLHDNNKKPINPDNYVNIISQQAIKKVNSYTFEDLLLIMNKVQDGKILKSYKSERTELTEKKIDEKISKLVNIKMFIEFLSNMKDDDIVILLTSGGIKNKLSDLYKLDYSFFILFRVLTLVIYFLYNEGIYKVQDVIIRLKIIQNLQFLFADFIKIIKTTINRVNMGDVKIALPVNSKYIGFTEKTYNQLLDSILNNIVVPTKIIDLFDLEIIKSGFIRNNNIEYFGNLNTLTLNNLTEKYKAIDNKKKYFWITLIILIVVILFKNKIFNK